MFHVLGDVCISGAAGTARFSSPRERTIISLLVVNVNQVVAMDTIVDTIWEEAPPKTARDQVYICISSIRRTLKKFDPGNRIETRSPGYRLLASKDQIDLQVFTTQLQEAVAEVRRGTATPASIARLRAAVTNWPGEPFPGVESSAVRSFAEVLSQRRLAAFEECIGLEIRLGQHRPTAEELAGLVVEYPLRTGFWFQYITVLRKLGRRADALLAYRRATREMTDALGVELDPALTQLHAELMTEADEDRKVNSLPQRHHASELPPDLSGFAGRERETALLRKHATPSLAGECRPVLVFGPRGAGKSALAIHVAHQIKGHFSDGTVYTRLRGDGNIEEVLRGFLLALGVAEDAIPTDVDAQISLYRRLTVGKRILVVVDNIVNEWQVSPLVPGAGRCSLIVVSRSRLAGLPGIERIGMTPLDHRRIPTVCDEHAETKAHTPGEDEKSLRESDRFISNGSETADALRPKESLQEATRILGQARQDLSRAAAAIAQAERALTHADSLLP